MRPAAHSSRLRRRTGCGRADAGALSLSYIIVFPAFLFAVMAIAQGSLWYLARETALAAARQGVDAARVQGASAGAGPPAALTFARAAAPRDLLSPTASDAGSTAQTIQITVTGHVPSLVPWMVIGVSQVARAPVEQFTTP